MTNDRVLDRMQRAAYYAWVSIENARKQPYRLRYAALAQGLPAMLQRHGLPVTLAFLLAKAKGTTDPARSVHRLLYSQVSQWVGNRVFGQADDDLMAHVIQGNRQQLRLATAEATRLARWLRRFAEAEFGKVVESDANPTTADATESTH